MGLNMSKLNNRLGTLLISCIYVIAFLIVHPSIEAQEGNSSGFNEYKGIYSPEAYWLYRVSEMSVSHSTDFPAIINIVLEKYKKLWKEKMQS